MRLIRKSFRTIAISLPAGLLVMFVAMTLTGSTVFFPGNGSGDNNLSLQGTVLDRKGNPAEGLTITAFAGEAVSPSPVLFSTTTCSDGMFNLTCKESGSYMLEVQGSSGSGRIYIPAGKRDNIEVTYPVTEEIVFLHTNDLHFDLNNLREFEQEITSIRERYDNVFLFSAGDIFVRHPLRWIVNGKLMLDLEWYRYRTSTMIETMNEQGYNLLTLGNHELAYIDPYTRLALELAKFPLLAANIEVSTESLPAIDHYTFLNTNTHRKIAVLGLSTDNSRNEGVKVLDLEETVQKYLPLKDSADIFMALTHIGLRRDRDLAGKFPEFDLIIGGHSHDLLEESIMVNGVLISQAGGSPHFVSDSHPVFLGKTIITLENGRISSKKGKVIRIHPWLEDDNILSGEEISPEMVTSDWQ